MDIREWILDYGIPQDFSLSDAIQLIAAYEDEYVPKFGRLGTGASQPAVEADAGRCADFKICALIDDCCAGCDQRIARTS